MDLNDLSEFPFVQRFICMSTISFNIAFKTALKVLHIHCCLPGPCTLSTKTGMDLLALRFHWIFTDFYT